MDPRELVEIGACSTRTQIRSLIKDQLIVRKNVEVHSRFRTLRKKEEKRKGRHTGIGKRRGASNARMPEKVLWMRR